MDTAEAIEVGETYLHYQKGHRYVCVGIAVNPNTYEEIVVYRAENLDIPGLYWRPVDEFRKKFSHA